jgi:hypothetical protein
MRRIRNADFEADRQTIKIAQIRKKSVDTTTYEAGARSLAR